MQRRTARAERRASASARKRAQSAASWPRHFKNPKYSRSRAGAASAAIKAPSVRKVPEPHIGSSSIPPASAICGHPARNSTAAATFSLSGARPPSAAVAAPMQTLAGEIQRHQCRGPLHVQMQQHIGALGLDVRPLAGGLAQIVANRILEQLRAVDRVPDGFIAAAAIARQRRPGRQVLAPIDALYGLIDALGTARIDGTQA